MKMIDTVVEVIEIKVLCFILLFYVVVVVVVLSNNKIYRRLNKHVSFCNVLSHLFKQYFLENQVHCYAGT